MTADTPTPRGASTPSGPSPRKAALRRFVLVALVLPILTVGAGVSVMLALADTLPDPVAIHWGADGAADGFGPLWMPVVVLAAVVVGMSALLAATTVPALRRGDTGGGARLLGAVSWSLAAFLTALVTIATAAQSGLTDATDGPSIWMPLLVAVAAGAVAGVLGFVLQPRVPFVPSPSAAAVPAEIGDGERVVWLQRAVMARGGTVFLAGATALMVVIAVSTWLLGIDPVGQVVIVLATGLIVFAVATNLVFHVRVDDAGLTVTSAAGWPRVRVPLADIESAAVVHVDPMAEFGGWGLRWGPNGRFGVVMRTGEGIEVRRRNGRAFTVTVDDSATGAGLLTALAARATP